MTNDADGDDVLDETHNCVDTPNAPQKDQAVGLAGDGLVDTCDPDEDNDTVLKEDDECPDSNIDAKLVIDGCDSLVWNQVLSNGATFNGLIAIAAADAKNHGASVKAVTQWANPSFFH